MHLYKHAARCPSVIQRFISFNPIYECFIPISEHKAEQQNQDYSIPPSLILLDNIYPTSIASVNRKDIPKTSKIRSDEEVRSCMRKLPPVPNGYTFSIPQRIKQFQYFKEKLDKNTKQNELVDLFNATIIAVCKHLISNYTTYFSFILVPDDATKTVRQFVESLFITHAETRLNTSGRLVCDDDTNNNNNVNIHHIHMNREAWIIDRGEWCRDVI